jgi:hypothetical protein
MKGYSESIQCNQHSSAEGRCCSGESQSVAQNEAQVSTALVEVEAGSLILGQELFISPDVATSGGAVGRLRQGGRGLKRDWSWCNDLWIWRLLCWVSHACSTIWSGLLMEWALLADTILGDVLNLWPTSWLGAASSARAD